jgi:hypothetical protein
MEKTYDLFINCFQLIGICHSFIDYIEFFIRFEIILLFCADKLD